MTEIPEHLRQRAEAARQKAAAASGAEAPSSAGEAAPAAASDPRIPAHLLERSRSAKSNKEGGGGTSTAVATAPAASAAAAIVASSASSAGLPVGAGPGGHTQRLLTVVKSGSIQDVKAAPVDKVHTWPHLLIGEFVASLACLAFTTVFSMFVNAPLQRMANPNDTPNPAKAPWYFLGLQEILTLFHPMVAGVTVPTIGLIALGAAPYIDKNPSQRPEDRKLAVSLFTMFLMAAAILTIIGSFFRGPGFNFVLPWRSGIYFEF
jgi:menaquinol-cytochrome c reductase cytochrome b/c subunit